MHEQVAERIQNVPVSNDRLSLSQFTDYAGSNGQLTRVLSYETDQPLGIRESANFVTAPLAFETKTTDGTSGNTETFSLLNDLIDSKATSQPISVFKDDGTSVTEVQPDSVNYSGDSFDFTDSGTGNDLYVFYASGDQARLIVRVTGPNGTQKDLLEIDAGLVHRRDKFDNPLRFDFERPLEGTVPPKFNVEQYIDAPYTTRYSYDGGTESVTAPNAIFSVPVRRAQEKIDGLARAVRHDIAES